MAAVNKVAIAGVGQSRRDSAYNKKAGWKTAVVEAVYEALKDARVDPNDLDGGVVNYHGEAYMGYGGLGPTLAEELGVAPVGIIPVVAQCTGGGITALTAWTQIVSGLHRRVLCLAFDVDDNVHILDNYNISNDSDWDYMAGIGHEEAAGLREQAYYRRYGYDLTVAARWHQQCYWYANRNPRAACYRVPSPPMEVLTREVLPGSNNPSLEAHREVAFTLGAAAWIMVPEQDAADYPHKPVYMTGGEYAVSPGLISKNYHYPRPGLETADITGLPATRVAAQKAYAMAGITPRDVDLAQTYSPGLSGVLQLEVLGICEPGTGGKFILDGGTAIDGPCPTNTNGGQIAFSLTSGSDVGDMLIESVQQLRGEVELPDRQVKNAKLAACAGYQAIGSGSTVTVLTNQEG